ncbi:hypothetical protein [Planomicrobium sp. CPCC 101110]|uniref:hypothetical protein n=1 Tax=Planomicrobium sp. CPCC 101110 TaxID=2599619 RepID=UPI0011B7B478|nr:hypothetical protein [Planomicrobium sp. CPCC 101110]TWT27749.1 hypothetical protein FQV30_04345 [Planomicrobium sp. CPCC 101110]
MKCEKCNHEQTTGKFCGKCGNALVAQTSTNTGPTFQQVSTAQPVISAPSAAPTYQAPTDPNLHVEKVKETSKQYWAYFLEHLKRPSTILERYDMNFINALITFAIFALVTALSINDMIGYLIAPVDEFSEMFVEESLKPSFVKILLYVVVALGVVFALSIGSLFAVSKFFGPQTHFKPLATMFGTYLIPSILVVFAAYLLLLIDSRGIGSTLFTLGLLFSIFVMPLFLITTLINQKSQQIDSFYAFIAYIVLFAIGLSIILSVFVDATLSDLISQINDLMGGYSSF